MASDTKSSKVVTLRGKPVDSDPPPPPEPSRVQIFCGCRSWPHFVWEALDNGWLVMTCTACGMLHVPTPKDFERGMEDPEFWPPDETEEEAPK